MLVLRLHFCTTPTHTRIGCQKEDVCVVKGINKVTSESGIVVSSCEKGEKVKIKLAEKVGTVTK